ARKQHIFLWKEWDYPYVFYGGSNATPGQVIYELMKQLGTTAPHLDGTKTSVSFTRASDRSAPHNAYTDLKFIIENAYDYTPRQRSIYFDNDAVIEGSPANEISFTYRSDNNVKYVYNSETQKFDRSINDTPMMDAENDQQLAVKNIIVQHANHFKVKGTPYTNIDLVDSGAAEYFTNGIMRTGTWERKSKDSLTIYYDVNGKEISFSPGVTFIQIVRTNTPISVK
ncbi:MAG: DUF3048 domain-containing protein, partial [Eubacteriaceae bacterium]|nr:DUF3048 domain-containing protein [Eubacteriaceae bacterium]